jgi:hypothetical protein
VPITGRIKNDYKLKKTQCWSRTPSLIAGRRRKLVGGLGFEKMRVAT